MGDWRLRVPGQRFRGLGDREDRRLEREYPFIGLIVYTPYVLMLARLDLDRAASELLSVANRWNELMIERMFGDTVWMGLTSGGDDRLEGSLKVSRKVVAGDSRTPREQGVADHFYSLLAFD